MSDHRDLFPDDQPTLIDLQSRQSAVPNPGFGSLASRNAAQPSANSAPAQSGVYVQADVQAILDELRDLKTKLRAAGILAT